MINRGKTTINYMPTQRYIVYNQPKTNSMNIISPNDLSDTELLSLGLAAKSANIANSSTEEIPTFEIIAIGPDVMSVEIGDNVRISPGTQLKGIIVENKTYLIGGEYDIEGVYGKFI